MSRDPPLRNAIGFTDQFSQWPLARLALILLLTALTVAVAWGNLRAGLVFAVFAIGDGLMLCALPRFKRSFGPPQLPWISLTAIRLLLTLFATLLPRLWSLPAAALLQIGLSVIATYACWVEPMRLGVTRITVRSPRLDGCPPLRLLQISDLHVERITGREHRLTEVVRELAPDIIVLTGDYLNISYTRDPLAQVQTRTLLSRLRAPGGVFAITGSPSVDPPEVVASLLNGLHVLWLRNRVAVLPWHGCQIQIAGVECSYDLAADERRLRSVLNGRASDSFTLLLYHTPDVMPAATQTGVDLYLAGHTHGGQLRVPLFGALVTASVFGKRYEMGTYRQGSTLLHVSRGVGLEGKGAPRARFLCPPEITLFTLIGGEH